MKNKNQRKKGWVIQKLSTKFIIIFTAVLVSVFILLMAAFQVTAKIYVDNYIENTIYSLQSDIDKGVTEVVDEATYMYDRMVKAENSELLDIIGEGKTNTMRQKAFTDLVQLAGINDHYFIDVGWQDKNGYMALHGFASPSEEVFEAAKEKTNALVMGGYRKGCNVLAIYMKNSLTKTEGTFIFFLLETALSDIYGRLNNQSGYSFIAQSDGFIVSHDDKNFVGKTLIFDNLFSIKSEKSYQISLIDNVKRIIVVGIMPVLNGKYSLDCFLINVMDYDFYYKSFTEFTLILLYIAAGFLVVGIILAVIRAKKITRPVENLNATINDVIKTGKKSNKVAKEGDEIYQLEKNYDEMISRIFKLMQKNKEEMELQRTLELEALQMQINPHFLYNTLDAVVWMAKIKKEPEIENLVVNLAQFFRLSLHRGDKYITVEEELEIVKHYFQIEKIRFRDKADIVFEVDEDITKYKTLKLILQPAVENAFKYAFPETSGKITIQAYGYENDIIFKVIDNGVGFCVPEDILKLKKEKMSRGTGYGIYNINERISLEYGQGYGLDIQSEVGEGTCVTMKIKKMI